MGCDILPCGGGRSNWLGVLLAVYAWFCTGDSDEKSGRREVVDIPAPLREKNMSVSLCFQFNSHFHYPTICEKKKRLQTFAETFLIVVFYTRKLAIRLPQKLGQVVSCFPVSRQSCQPRGKKLLKNCMQKTQLLNTCVWCNVYREELAQRNIFSARGGLYLLRPGCFPSLLFR